MMIVSEIRQDFWGRCSKLNIMELVETLEGRHLLKIWRLLLQSRVGVFTVIKENCIKFRGSSGSTSIFATVEMLQISISSKVSCNTVNSKTFEYDATAKSILRKIDVAVC